MLGTRAAFAQDEISAPLAAARERYEAERAKVREETEQRVHDQLTNLSQAKPIDEQRLAKVERELAEFRRTGAWPSSTTLELRSRAAKNVEAMRDAYVAARIAAAKQNNEPIQQAIIREVTAFESHTDMAAWGENLIGEVGDTARRLESSSTPLEVDLSAGGEYRLEIQAKRTAAIGELVCQVPLTNGRRLTVPTEANADGSIRVLLTVYRGLVAADLGAKRPLNVADAEETEDAKLLLSAKGGPIELLSVRTHSVQERVAAPKKSKKPVTKAAPREKDEKEAAAPKLEQGSRWTGTRHVDRHGEQDTLVTVGKRTGKTVILRIPEWGGCGTDVLTVRVNGSNLTVTGMRYEGSRPRVYRGVRGSGRIVGGRLYLSYSCKLDAGRLRNQSVSGSIDVTAEE
ncbi:MAG: hypothetical protein ACOYN0_15155 [Phycisphaerales bacterium]